MARRKHEDVLEAVEKSCPRCGAAREPRQEYCVECGLRLPPATGPIPALRRRWVRRLGWYPGDWVWVSLVTLVVAIAGAAAAIALGSNSSSSAGTTAVAPPPPSVPATTNALQTVSTPTVSTTQAPPPKTTPATTVAAPPAGRTPWPPNQNGWTVVLFSYPVTGGTAAPDATAAQAAGDGLQQVGVLESGQFASLHPGYYVVFSGIYSSDAQASAALGSVHAAGFASAYPRQIAR